MQVVEHTRLVQVSQFSHIVHHRAVLLLGVALGQGDKHLGEEEMGARGMGTDKQ